MKAFCDKLDAFLDNYYKVNHNSGMLRVTIKDRVIYERFMGYADIENKTEFSAKSMFTLYSLSKPFCAIGLLKLKDKHLLNLDAHPGDYLEEAKGFHPALTIRRLLNHTSGIPDFDQNTDFRQKYHGETSKQLREQLLLLSRHDMMFEPGTKGQYANVNFIICALLCERISGMRYADYLKQEVLEPLEMKAACVDYKTNEIAHRVKGYNKQDNLIVGADRVTEWIMGGADIIATVDDVYCLNKAIKEKLLLKNETWDEVLTPSPINSMGFGCTVTNWHNKKRITHNGGWEGFRTLHIQLPEDDFDIIFLSNSAWGDARADISEAIYQAYYGDDSAKSDTVTMDTGYAK